MLLAFALLLVSTPAVVATVPKKRPGSVLLVSVASVPVEVRVGRRGEQVLGITDFRRRASARSNPMAPVGRYEERASNVLIAAVGTERLMLETSVFNSHHGASVPQSVAARLSVSPASDLVLQVSYGSLLSSERHDRGQRLSRMSASTTVTHAGWSTTALWGVSVPSTDEPLTNGALLESALDLDEHHNLFGRLEYMQRSAVELHVATETPSYDIASGSLGYVYTFSPFSALVPAIGIAASLDVQDRRLSQQANTNGLNPGALLFARGTVD